MPTLIEKTEAKLKKLQEQADKKRLKAGLDQMWAGVRLLSPEFHDPKITAIIRDLADVFNSPPLTNLMNYLK